MPPFTLQTVPLLICVFANMVPVQLVQHDENNQCNKYLIMSKNASKNVEKIRLAQKKSANILSIQKIAVPLHT